MKINRSNESWKLYLLQKSLGRLAMFASLLVFLITNAAMAQVTTSPSSEREPIDPAREKQKEVYFEKLEKGEIAPAKEQVEVQSQEPVDPTREQQKADFAAGKNRGLPEGFPVFKETGNFEADKEAYRIAKDAWIANNPGLIESVIIPSVPTEAELQERERILKTN